jgi:hypothetical protein
MTAVPENPAERDDVEDEHLLAFYETSGLAYAEGRFDAGDEHLFDEEIEQFASEYARHCLMERYTPLRQFYDAYVRGR